MKMPSLIALTLLPFATLAQVEYEVTFVSKESEFDFRINGNALNSQGVVAGTSSRNLTQPRASTWYAGKLTRFDGLGAGGYGLGINRWAQVVGEVDEPGTGRVRAAHWEADGTFRPLNVPFQGVAWHIADDGTISGEAYLAGVTRVFFWKNGEHRILPALGRGPTSFPTAMNNRGTIVGYENSREGGFVGAWIWSPERGLSELPGFISPRDINDQGVVAFNRSIVSGLYNELGIRLLRRGDFEYAEAIKLNNEEAVIGEAFLERAWYGVLWRTPTSQPVALDTLIDPTLRIRIVRVKDINDAGQILALAESAIGPRTFYIVRLDPRAPRRPAPLPQAFPSPR
jgi:uncharacterized membrane protein